MKLRSTSSRILAGIAMGAIAMIPAVALAQSNWHDQGRDSRQDAGHDSGYSHRSSGRGQDSADRGSSDSRDHNITRPLHGDRGDDSGHRNWSGGNGNHNDGFNQNRGYDRDGGGSWNRGWDRNDGWRDGGLSIGIGFGVGVRDGGYSDNDYDWNAIAGQCGGLTVIADLNDDDTLYFDGSVGALYSFDAYDEDRVSNDRVRRLRAAYFSRPYFIRDGQRYERTEVVRHGDHFYQFRRG
jgi:hypothetical protein